MSPSQICQPSIENAGYENRTPLVLARERGLYAAMVADLGVGDGAGSDGESEPGIAIDQGPSAGDEPVVVTTEMLERAIRSRDISAIQAASFIAGRCETDDKSQRRQLVKLLGGLLDGLDPTDLGSRSLPYVEAAMSLVLLGEVDRGTAALRVVLESAEESMGDYLAAFYLAELGNPGGYPVLARLLSANDGFTRLMAARHLAGFLPYDGQMIDGEQVDVRARLIDRLDDEDELVALEIPGLLAEGDVEGLEPLLEKIAAGHRDDVGKAAQHVLEHLQGRA